MSADQASPSRVLLVGGSSEIGVAIVRRLADEHRGSPPLRTHLLGRDQVRLDQSGQALEQADCEVHSALVDADDLGSHQGVIADAFAQSGGFDLVVIAIGLLGAQQATDASPEEANAVMSVNFLGTGSLLLHCARALERQGGGTIVVLSSVAAERPRASNAIYGAAKAGLDALAQGLADRASDTGVRVLVVRPGFVKTRMTEGLKTAPFATTAEAVAEATVQGLRGSAHTVWVPGRLRFVFSLLRHVPRPVFRRLPL